MNKLKTTDLGGFRLRSNDFRWQQNANEMAFKSILNSVDNSKTIILSGCVITGITPALSISSGYVSIEGEVIFVPAQSFTVPTLPDVAYLEVQTSWDPTGLKVFKNSIAHDTYEIRTAVVTTGALPVNRTNILELKTIIQSIGELLSATSWNSLPGASYVAAMPAGPPMFMRDNLGFIHFKGQWNNDDPAGITVIGVLPVGSRPANQMDYNFYNLLAGTTFTLSILPDGNMTISPTCPQDITLCQIVPFKAV